MTHVLSTIITSVYVYVFALISCSNHATDNISITKSLVDSSSTTVPVSKTGLADDEPASKDDLAKIDALSVAEYIKAVNKEYRISFDTLFFGNHKYGQPDDFPDIELPESIENTHIRLISPEAGLQKQKGNKSSFYINLIGWVDDEKAKFTFVTFSNGFEHQFDCFINYKYNTASKEFELENTRFEDYLYKKK